VRACIDVHRSQNVTLFRFIRPNLVLHDRPPRISAHLKFLSSQPHRVAVASQNHVSRTIRHLIHYFIFLEHAVKGITHGIAEDDRDAQLFDMTPWINRHNRNRTDYYLTIGPFILSSGRCPGHQPPGIGYPNTNALFIVIMKHGRGVWPAYSGPVS
jgi:hypothetical protein